MDIDIAKELIILLSDAIEIQKATNKMKGISNRKELTNLIDSKVNEIQKKVEEL